MEISLDKIASPEYRAMLKERYEQPGWGGSGYHHWITVASFAREIGAKTILDYGCGRGKLKEALVEFSEFKADQIREFDPGIVGKEALPEPADLLVATDVLEHVELNKLSNVLQHMRSLSKLGCYFIIATNRSRQTLSDGRNAHLIQRPGIWWLSTLKNKGLRIKDAKVMKGVHVWVHHSQDAGSSPALRSFSQRHPLSRPPLSLPVNRSSSSTLGDTNVAKTRR